MFNAVRQVILRYALATGVVMLAATLVGWFDLRTSAEAIPLYLIAIGLAAWFGGIGPGLAAVGLAAGSFLLIAQMRTRVTSFDVPLDLVWLLCLVAAAMLIGHLNTQRHEAAAALRERDMRLRVVSEQIPGGLWSTDRQLRITSVFGALLAGPENNALLNRLFRLADADPSDPAVAAHTRALAGERSTFELQAGARTLDCHAELLRNDAGQTIGVVGVAMDITDRKDAEQKLQHATEAKDRFLAMLSHELRTPLTPALVAATEMVSREDLPASVREDLELIRRNIELEATLIDDLLDLTRVSSGKLKLRRETVDVHDLIRRTLETCRSDVSDKAMKVELDLTADQHWVFADAARLQQVYWNLLKNAVKFTPTGGTITVRTVNPAPALNIPDATDNELIVEVRDTGIGIEPPMLEKIFHAFEQGEPGITRQFGGLGLGLAISRALVDAHEGVLSAESEGKGCGATFRVTLPVAPSPAWLEVAPPNGKASVNNSGQALRLLLVEDHPDTLRLMARLLRKLGHDVFTASSGEAALEAAANHPFDLIISDLGLPDLSGIEMMRRIGARKPTKAIALSGFGSDRDVREAREAGFTRHLTKPVNLQLLADTIHEIVNHAEGDSGGEA